MNWKHIMECQPEHDRSIIQCEGPASDGHYTFGMRNYSLIGTWQEFITWIKNNDLDNPDFYWMYIEDFPFPKLEKGKTQREKIWKNNIEIIY